MTSWDTIRKFLRVGGSFTTWSSFSKIRVVRIKAISLSRPAAILIFRPRGNWRWLKTGYIVMRGTGRWMSIHRLLESGEILKKKHEKNKIKKQTMTSSQNQNESAVFYENHWQNLMIERERYWRWAGTVAVLGPDSCHGSWWMKQIKQSANWNNEWLLKIEKKCM